MIDRSDAVNLARNYLDRDYPPLTPHGVKTLAEAVMAMDEYIAALTPRSETEASSHGDAYKEAVAQNLKLRKALEQCVRVAQSWHGDDDFDLYFNHAPEMKLIRDALGKMPDPTEAPK